MEKLVQNWHSFWIRFNETLLEGCICENERSKICNKIKYHTRKLEV